MHRKIQYLRPKNKTNWGTKSVASFSYILPDAANQEVCGWRCEGPGALIGIRVFAYFLFALLCCPFLMDKTTQTYLHVDHR